MGDRVLKLVTPVLGAIFLVLLFVSARLMFGNRFWSAEEPTEAENRSYQFAFFLPASSNAFFAGIKEGALQAARATDCAVIFHSLAPDDLSFEMAPYAGSNGVAVFSYDKSERMVHGLERILARGLPVVQIENEVVNSPKTVLIGTNSYDSGKSIAKIAMTSDKRRLHVALIYSDKNPALMADANLVEIGVKSIMGARLSQLTTERTTFNPIDAEGVIYDLLREAPSTDIIALTDSNDTLVAVQAIIDLNLVGTVQIIGFGDDRDIIEYIDKGVVLGTIVRNPFEIGYQAVTALREICANGNTSAYVNTGVKVITGRQPHE